MKKYLALTLLLFCLVSFVAIKSEIVTDLPKVSNLEEGDIVFQSSNSEQSIAVKLATHSKFSHVGILINEGGELKVLEAVEPVRIVSLESWLKEGEKGFFEAKRLKDNSILTEEVKVNMTNAGKALLNKHYDLYFGWEDDRIYCSELVYKVYERGAKIALCDLKPLKDYDLSHPRVKAKLAERYGKNIPMNEPMVSPEDIYRSPLLISVH